MRILWCEQRHSNTAPPKQLRDKISVKLKNDITFVWNDDYIDFPREYPKGNYDVVLLYFSLKDFQNKWQTLENYAVPKAMIVSDPQTEMFQHIEYVRKFQIDMLLFLYPAWIPEYQKYINCKMKSFPWWVDDCKKNVEKDIDLTYAVEGVSYSDTMSIRWRMAHNEYIRTLNIKKQTIGFPRIDNYFDVLNRTKLLVFDGTRANNPILKFVEGMMTECCILAPTPITDEPLHLKQYENYIPITVDNYYDKILEYLNDNNATTRIALNGRSTYIKHHTTEIRMNELIHNLEMLINAN